MQNTNVKFIYFHAFVRNSILLALYYNSFQSFRCQNKILLISKHPHGARQYEHAYLRVVLEFSLARGDDIYYYINMKWFEKQNNI